MKVKSFAVSEDVGKGYIALDEEALKVLPLAYLVTNRIVSTWEELRSLFVTCSGNLANWQDQGLGLNPISESDSDRAEAYIAQHKELGPYFAQKVEFSFAVQARGAAGAIGGFFSKKIGN